MRSRVHFVVHCLVAVVLAAVGLFALVPTVGAQQVAVESCRTATATSAQTSRSLELSRRQLLPRDGRGFFTSDIDRIIVHATTELPEVHTAASDAERLLRKFYGDDTVAIDVLAHAQVPKTTATTRVVVLNGDVAVPGQPHVFSLGGSTALYLHWSSAGVDLGALLDVPAFEAMPVGTPDCGPASSSLGDVPSDLLAYVASEEPATAAVDSDDRSEALPTVPVADSTTRDSLPLPIIGAAIVLTAGGVVVHRRDRIFGSEPSDPSGHRAPAGHAALRFPIADQPPAKPRVIYLDDETHATDPALTDAATHRRQIDLHATRAESPLTQSVEKLAAAAKGLVLPREEFATLVNAEWSRRKRGGTDGAVASLVLSELDAVRLRLGPTAAQQLLDEVAAKIATIARPLDVLGMAGENELAILMPEADEGRARDSLDEIAKAIAATSFSVRNDRVLLTPATGFAMLSDTQTAPDLVRAVESARALSMLNLHLDPERWDGTSPTTTPPGDSPRTWAAVKDKLRTPLQILLTVVLSWVVPFFGYVAFDAMGLDISFLMYLFVVAALVITGAFILAEGLMAIKQKEPPEVPTVPYPKASALIAAYLPNEAATVIETIEAFLALDYPNEIQIILAYNTPDTLPVEEHLDRLAAEHPNFVPVRIVGSNSKAQNVNAALSMADGEFIGMFDADHQPRADAFTRAWRWIDAGYDVVQGHCLTRNGDAGFLAKMIAVEFESIYAVAHPGRAKMHRFGVFGGSNGFWRTELLHETRMRGSMLTEDIDSSMRVVERGFKIRSDRDLVSRELATTTFKQVWNQRMRWAQGWFQVSIEHVKFSVKSKELTIRQKLGLFHLLMWREIYPWLSQQLFPLLAFWAVRAGGFEKLNWTMPIFLATTIFTFSIGPLQTIFAYKLADPEIKQHKSWFWAYLLFTTPFYTEYKNLIARVAHIKQFMGESNWRVTPRSADPVSAEL